MDPSRNTTENLHRQSLLSYLVDEVPRKMPVPLNQNQSNYPLDPSTPLPSLKQPYPAEYNYKDFQNFSDPDLCITPEKSGKGKRGRTFPNTLTNTVPTTWPDISKSNSATKVRFHEEVKVKDMTPETSTNDTPQSQLAEDISFEDIIGPNLSGSEEHLDGEDEYEDDDENEIGAASDSSSNTLTEGIEECYISNDTNNNGQDIDLQSDERIEFEKKVPYYLADMSENQLARPEIHTTLRIGKKLDELKQKDINISKAIEKKLKTSPKTKEKLTEKVSSKLNIESQQFAGLVSVEVQEDEVESKFTVDAKKLPSKPASLQKDLSIPAPDLMEFFTSSLQREVPNYNLHSLPSLEPQLSAAPSSDSFDVYNHIRVWEAL